MYWPFKPLADCKEFAFIAAANLWDGRTPQQQNLLLHLGCEGLRFDVFKPALLKQLTLGFKSVTVWQVNPRSTWLLPSSAIYIRQIGQIDRW